MNFKQMWRAVDNAGDKQDQVTALMAIWIVASQAFVSRAEDLRTKATIYLRRLERWRDDLLCVFNWQPFVIQEDRERAVKFFLSAVVVLLIETAIGTAIAYRNGWPLVSGAFIALTLAIVLDAAFILACWRAKRPREAVDKLRRYFLYPSLIIFGFALPIFFLGRMIRGEMAVALANIITLSLWAATICLLVLGATLLACAYVYNWSYRDKGVYDKILDAQTALRVTMDKVLRELLARGVETDPLIDQLRQDLKARNLLTGDSNATPPIQPGIFNNTAATAVKLLPVLLIAVTLSGSACTLPAETFGNGATGSSASQVPHHLTTPVDILIEAPPQDTECDLIVGIDGTGSSHKDANKMAANNLSRDAARVVVSQGVRNIRVFEFIGNGNVPQERLNLDVPKFIRQQSTTADAGEAGIMPNIQEGVDEENKKRQDDQMRASLTEHVNNVNKVLSAVTIDKLMPSAAAEPKCSDINGFLSFLTTLSGERPRIVVMYSDGVENCASGIAPRSIPGNLTLIVMVLPLSPEEAEDDRGIDIKYQDRINAIGNILRGAVVVPYNVNVYQTIIEARQKKRG